MADNIEREIETFLLEDVVLTLGTLRSALGWLSGLDSEASREERSAGFDRLDRQLGLVEDRAREICRSFRSEEASGDACSAETQASTAMFRSRRL